MPPKKTIKSAPGKPPARRAYAPRAYAPKATYTRRATTYRGHGDYIKAPKAIRASKATRNTLGGTIGAHLGHGLQTVIKALTGFGDYEVEDNSLMPGKLGGDPPIIKNTTNNSHIVHHREYIGDVYASSAFTSTVYPINPGLISSFPWVSQQADSYEQYKFRGLVFEFKSMSSDAVLATSASSALGTVIMSTQYNVLDLPFSDKRTMENYEYANSTKPSCSILHPIECKMSQTSVAEQYIRTGAVTQGDLRLYDLGNFSIAVQGLQNAASNQVIGELWCSYEIEFFKPKLLIGGGALLTDHFSGSSPTILVTSPFGNTGTMTLQPGSNLGCKLQVTGISPYAFNSIIFPSYVVDGLYQVTYFLNGTVSTATCPSYSATGTTVNIDVVSTSVKILYGATQSYYSSPVGGSTSTVFMVVQILKILQVSPGFLPGIGMFFPSGVFPTGTVICDLVVTQLQSTIT